jgi:hypothetical protein
MRSILLVILASVQPLIAQTGLQPEEEKKSVPQAVMYSLVLPGMGELYAGEYGIGKYFTIAEGALWATLLGFDRYGTWLQDDSRSFAAQHAGITTAGKSDQYFMDVGNFNSVVDYNEQMLRDRDPHKLYDEQSFRWFWDSPANRQIYRDRRVSSDQMFNDTRFVAAAIAVNHIVSAINAARLVIAHNKSLESSSSIDIRATVIGGFEHPNGIMISFVKSF